MAKAYNVSIDYLLLEDARRRPLELAQGGVAQLEVVSEEDEKSLLHLIDAIEAKNKLKVLAADIG